MRPLLGTVNTSNNVTACLITWKRQHNLPQIIQSLVRWPFFDEIIIWDNSKAENYICYGRYLAAQKARNKYVYFQDDDCVNRSLDSVYEGFIGDPTRICHSGHEGYEKVLSDNRYGHCQMAMAGWGSFSNKEWFPVLDKYIAVHGKDDCFYRETDRIFSILLERHHNFVLGNLEMLDGHRGPEALSEQGGHLDFKKLAIARALEIVNHA